MEPQKGGAGKYCGKYSMIFPHFGLDEQFQVNSFPFRTARSDGQEEEHVPISGC